MNAIDVIFFQAEIAPDKLALVAHGSIIPYNRFVNGILSAQQRLSAIGVQCRPNRGALDRTPDRSHGVCLRALPHEGSIGVDHAVRGHLSRSRSIRHGAVGQDPHYGRHQAADRQISFGRSELVSGQGRISTSASAPAAGAMRVRLGGAHHLPSRASRHSVRGQNHVAGAGRTVDVLLPQRAGQLGPHDFGRRSCKPIPALFRRCRRSGSDAACALPTFRNARSLSNLYRHDYLVVGTEDVETLLRLQEVEFEAMKGLRAACFEGRANSASVMTRGLATISSNLLVRYVHPEAGIVAYGDASRLQRHRRSGGLRGALGGRSDRR